MSFRRARWCAPSVRKRPRNGRPSARNGRPTRPPRRRQEVEEVIPEWVATTGDGTKVLNMIGFEAMAIEAIKELNSKDQELERRIQALEQAAKGS